MPPPSSRLPHLDLLRFLAIILMLINHTLVYFLDLSSLTPLHHRLSLNLFSLTTISSALFLFISGYCLYLSLNSTTRSPSSWIISKLKSALTLTLISLTLFFSLHSSYQTGHPLSSGILQTIGVLWILSSPLIYLRSHPRLTTFTLVFLIIVVLALSTYFQSLHLHIPFLSSHSFPLFPHSAYFFAGILFSHQRRHFQPKHLIFIGLTLTLIIYLTTNFSIISVFSSPHVYTQLGFWQPKLIMSLFTIGTLLIFLGASQLLPPQTFHLRPLRRSVTLGRHSLLIYVLHLGLISLLSHLLPNP